MIWDKIKEFLFGIDVMNVDEAVDAFTEALVRIDADQDGNISVRELIRAFKEVCRGKRSVPFA